MTSATPDAGRTVASLNRVEQRLGQLLRVGVALSTIIIAIGLLTSLVRHPDYISDHAALTRLVDSGAAFPHSLNELGRELVQLRGRAIVTLGLLLLIVTPVMRVAVSIVSFALERDWRFVVITTTVLVVLLTSFVLGKVE